jgi:hypothetical protein
MAAPFLMETPPRRVLVVAPSRQLREQLAGEFRSYAQLKRLGVLSGELPASEVIEVAGRVGEWRSLEAADVVVALPNSISPVHYDEGFLPPRDLFDLLIVDEAHHAPADTWRAIIDHFELARALLLTATPRRRDGKRIPGVLQFYYPLRRALDEGFYKPVEPQILEVPQGGDRSAVDRLIVARVSDLFNSDIHSSSVLVVRGRTIDRLKELKRLYADHNVDVEILHNGLSKGRQSEIIDQLTSGNLRAVAVAGMLGEGFDLPAIRLLAYHDKHRSLAPTVQLIGRLARVDDAFPQPSVLVAAADADVFPELKGVVRELYEEDADWIEVLPGVIDSEIRQEREDRDFIETLPASRTEVDPIRLRPTKRALVYEVPHDWLSPFEDGQVPEPFVLGERFGGGVVAYSGASRDAGLLVVVTASREPPKWSSDPALTNVRYELHIAAHRKPPRVDLPGFVLLNLERDGVQHAFEMALGLDVDAHLAGPERLGEFLDSLDRISVSSVGVRSTNAATRGRASYRNFMGSGVDRGLRTVDMARAALGHVMFQVRSEGRSANAGGAVEKSKLWLTRYGPLRELSAWVDATAQLLWFPRQTAQGPLLPGVDRGQRLEEWPQARPLAAEIPPALLGLGIEILDNGQIVGALEDLDLFVNDDPTGTLEDVGAPGAELAIVAVFNDREGQTQTAIWQGTIDLAGRVRATHDVDLRRGYGVTRTLSEVLQESPPTIYFLDGTTTIGPIRYDSRALISAFDPDRLVIDPWPAVDPTAETDRTAAARGLGVRSIHARLADYLIGRERIGVDRWILLNDGSGEIADYIVIEELSSGEIHVALWHAKAAAGATPSVRIKDWQEVSAQALRSRRWLPSTSLWSELAGRLNEEVKPFATLIDGGGNRTALEERLGLRENEDVVPWTRRLPVVRGLIGIAQPGLSVHQFRADLAANEDGALAIRELFSMLADTTVADGAELIILVSE